VKITWHEPKAGEPPFSVTIEAYDFKAFRDLVMETLTGLIDNWEGLSQLAELSPEQRRKLFEELQGGEARS